MPIITLTDLAVRKLKAPPQGQTLFIDEDLPGFAVRVTANGAKSYVLTYGTNRKRITLGTVGIVPLKDARKRAKDLLAEHQLSGAKTPTPTFKAARQTYLQTGQWKPSTEKENRRLLERHFADLEDKTLDTITTADIMAIIDDLTETPSERAHAFTAIKSFIRWSAGRGYSADLLASLRKPKTAPPRARTLTDEEIRILLKTTPSWGVYGQILELLLFTGQRVGQFAPTFTGTVTNDRIVWPAAAMKGNREHSIPLTARVNSLLSRLTDFNNFSTAHTRFLAASKIPHFTRHDLRRTFASGWQRLGIPVEVTEAALAHRSGTMAGVTGIYQRYDYFSEVQTAMTKWERHLLKLTR